MPVAPTFTLLHFRGRRPECDAAWFVIQCAPGDQARNADQDRSSENEPLVRRTQRDDNCRKGGAATDHLARHSQCSPNHTEIVLPRRHRWPKKIWHTIFVRVLSAVHVLFLAYGIAVVRFQAS